MCTCMRRDTGRSGGGGTELAASFGLPGPTFLQSSHLQTHSKLFSGRYIVTGEHRVVERMKPCPCCHLVKPGRPVRTGRGAPTQLLSSSSNGAARTCRLLCSAHWPGSTRSTSSGTLTCGSGTPSGGPRPWTPAAGRMLLVLRDEGFERQLLSTADHHRACSRQRIERLSLSRSRSVQNWRKEASCRQRSGRAP